MHDALPRAILIRLQEFGWMAEPGPAFASRRFAGDDLTPDSVALAFLVDPGPDINYLILGGDYQGGGRNLLETHAVMIPKEADGAVVYQQTKRFSVKAESVAATRYALAQARRIKGATPA